MSQSAIHLSSPPPDMQQLVDILSTPVSSQMYSRSIHDSNYQIGVPIVRSNDSLVSPVKEEDQETVSKRRAQNREAQRKFRERKERYIKQLEDQVKELEDSKKKMKEELERENGKLKSIIDDLRKQLDSINNGENKTTLSTPPSITPLPPAVEQEVPIQPVDILPTPVVQPDLTRLTVSETPTNALPLEFDPTFKFQVSPTLLDGSLKRVPTCDIIEAINAIRRQPGDTDYEINWKTTILSYLDNNLIDLEDLCRMVFKVNCEKKRKYVAEIVEERLKMARLS